MQRWRSVLVLVVGLALVGCDNDARPVDGGGGRDATTGDAGSPPDSGAPRDGGLTDSGLPSDAGPPPDGGLPSDSGPGDGGVPSGSRVLVGHLGGSSFRLHQFDTGSLSPTTGSPYEATRAYTDVAVDPVNGRVAIVQPGNNSVALLNRDLGGTTTFSGLTTTPLTATFSGNGDRLFVYAADGASERRMFIYDLTGAVPAEVSGSPFTVTFVAASMVHDATTDRLYGVSATSQWAADVGPSGLTLVGGSTVSGGAVGLAIDVPRRRFYATRSFPSRLVVRDMDSFEEVSGSPLALPGDFPTSLALDPDSGDLFLLDGASPDSTLATTLHYITASPLAVQDTCGAAAGCTLDSSETGLAFDPLTDRLFVSVTRGDGPGELSVFDVSTPAMPTEVSTARPSVGPVPAWVWVY